MSAVVDQIRTRWVRGLWAVAIAVGLIVTIVGAQSIIYPSPTAVVRKGDIVHRFVAQGRVESRQIIDLFPEASAVIRAIHVDEGDAVEAGQTLIELDEASLKAAHQEAMHAAAAAKALWDGLQAETREEIIDAAEAQVLTLEGQWEAAVAQENAVQRGPRTEEIEQAKQLLEAAKAEEETATKQHDRALKLSKDLSRSELEELQLRVTAARTGRLAREAQWNLLTVGASNEEKAQAKASVKSARGRLQQAQAELQRLKTGATVEERQAAESRYLQAQDAVERTRILLSKAKICSPFTGTVLRRFHHPGELVHPQIPLPLLVLCDDTARELRVEVMEGDVYKVKPGQPVSIKSDSYVGSRWEGRVARLAPVMGQKRLMSEHPREKTDVKVLEAWIVPDARLELPINVPVEVTAHIVVRKDVTVIPWRCVSEPGQTVRLSNGTAREVELGERDDGFVEVRSGLQVGERLLLPK